MALKFGIGSKKSVGIDIGSSSIKVIELSKSGHKYYIDVLDTIDLPSGAVGGGIVNDAASTASYLKNSLAKHGVSEKKSSNRNTLQARNNKNYRNA
jgi:Tfp pilus assembly protein, ATPase PilM